MQLIIGNKNYSSWSMRPWVALTAFGIPFKAGELILSGSLAPLVPAVAGDRFSMHIEGLGDCSIAFSE